MDKRDAKNFQIAQISAGYCCYHNIVCIVIILLYAFPVDPYFGVEHFDFVLCSFFAMLYFPFLPLYLQYVYSFPNNSCSE